MAEMTMQAMEAAPEMQAGSYGESFWFKMIVNYLERKFPGSKDIIERAAAVIPWAKLWQAIQHALADWQAGQDFLTILLHVLEEWLTVEPATPDAPIRFTAKA